MPSLAAEEEKKQETSVEDSSTWTCSLFKRPRVSDRRGGGQVHIFTGPCVFPSSLARRYWGAATGCGTGFESDTREHLKVFGPHGTDNADNTATRKLTHSQLEHCVQHVLERSKFRHSLIPQSEVSLLFLHFNTVGFCCLTTAAQNCPGLQERSK